jgi:NAD(P)-dependent dehydrogenase (short-subunit alcohol dehydrogenase family)
MPKGMKPAQKQARQPGSEAAMDPQPDAEPIPQQWQLDGRVALITGGDSGIGRAVALLFAEEGASVAFTYFGDNEADDAKKTEEELKRYGSGVLVLKGDLKKPAFCKKIVERTVATFGKLDILVNNAAVQYPQSSLEDISDAQLKETFETNIFGYLRVARAALPHLPEGGAIINTASITAYEGHPELIDYSATKGAIVSFTRALANNVAKRGIRVNAVAPGPVWTPLIPSSFKKEKVGKFGAKTKLGRPAEPNELAPAYLYLASDHASYVAGQTIHVNGGSYTSS